MTRPSHKGKGRDTETVVTAFEPLENLEYNPALDDSPPPVASSSAVPLASPTIAVLADDDDAANDSEVPPSEPNLAQILAAITSFQHEQTNLQTGLRNMYDRISALKGTDRTSSRHSVDEEPRASAASPEPGTTKATAGVHSNIAPVSDPIEVRNDQVRFSVPHCAQPGLYQPLNREGL